MSRSLQLLRSLLAGCLLALIQVPTASGLELELTSDAAVVHGLAPGGQVALLSVWRERVLDAATRVTRLHELLTDDDGDGTARLELGRSAPPGSLWILVDLAAGDYLVTAPPELPVRELTVDPQRFRRHADRIVLDRTDVEILAVRPGAGAWSLSLSDGGDRDGDFSDDGRATAVLADLVALGEASTEIPDSLEAGDVVAAIDVHSLELLTVRIAQ